MLPSTESGGSAATSTSSPINASPLKVLLSPIFVIQFVLYRLATFQWRRMLNPKVLFGWEDITPRGGNTAWLDGLRGVLAIQVYHYHFFSRYTDAEHSYGTTPEDTHLHQLSIFRPFFFGGPAAVSAFLVISGFVLSIRSFGLIRQRRYEDLFDGVCSSFFRRGFRLYLPVIGVSIPALVLMQSLDNSRLGFTDTEYIKSSWTAQFGDWFKQTEDLVNPYTYKGDGYKPNYYPYVTQAWTIPMEYYGSAVCYLIVMIVSQIDAFKTRAVVIGFVAFYAVHRGCWWVSNFLVGMLLADWTHERRENGSSSVFVTSSARRNLVFYGLLLIGVYLQGTPSLGFPAKDHAAVDAISGLPIVADDAAPVPERVVKPGYEFIYNLTPSFWFVGVKEDTRFWWYVSGTLIVIATSQLHTLRSILEKKMFQWLGKLSYSFYLVQLLVISTTIATIEGLVYPFTAGSKTLLCVLTYAAMTPVVIAFAALVERSIDRPALELSKWMEARTMQKEEVTLNKEGELNGLLRQD